jgi:hypothetical protein
MAMKNINKFKQVQAQSLTHADSDSGRGRRYCTPIHTSLECPNSQLGREAKTEATEEFKELELEMSMRQDGTTPTAKPRLLALRPG